jgi:uncharacterized coiled-coil protein SlyX
MASEHGARHRWDDTRSRCLDCGREAAEIVDELYDWLGQTEDEVDQMADQIEAMRSLLEDWQERYKVIEYVPHNWGPPAWVCQSCGAETRATFGDRQAGPPEPFPHTTFCKAEATRALLAKLEADQ